jgi:pimeloyl-ACP methyl ester carboxylesterase
VTRAPIASRPLLLLGVLAAPLVAGCADADDDESPAPPSPWTACDGGFECAELEVPVDHETAGGLTFTLPLLRRRAASPDQRIGSLVVNPGGPWSSGVQWVRALTGMLPAPILERFDVVGFDPRGSGGSLPSIDCMDDLGPYAALDLTPDDEAERQALVAGADALVASCESRSGDLLPHVGVDAVARDLDLIRELLGDERLTYLGLSYGTLLGAVYADLFPDRVRALVLDGAMDPSLAGATWVAEQGRSFEAQLDDFLADCAVDPSCVLQDMGDPAATYDALQASIEAAPLPAGDRLVGPGELAYGVVAALYQPRGWPRLRDALFRGAQGDGSQILELADGYLERNPETGAYGNGLEVYYAVTSIDAPFVQDQAIYDALVAELAVDAPRLGVYFPYTAFPSARWPVAPWRAAAPVAADGAPPLLVVGSTRDPATPHEWAVSLAAQLSSGVLLTREGQGHVAFLRGNECIDQAVTAYLVDGAAPADGTVCP